MNNAELQYETLHIPNVNEAIRTLTRHGILKTTDQGLVYLDIDDDYIHLVYPLIQKEMDWVEKPDYFGTGLIGAHISVIYPEEKISLNPQVLQQKHFFNTAGLFAAKLGSKKYYVLRIKSPTLIDLRLQNGLPEKLWFKEQFVDLHITVATSPLFSE